MITGHLDHISDTFITLWSGGASQFR